VCVNKTANSEAFENREILMTLYMYSLHFSLHCL